MLRFLIAAALVFILSVLAVPARIRGEGKDLGVSDVRELLEKSKNMTERKELKELVEKFRVSEKMMKEAEKSLVVFRKEQGKKVEEYRENLLGSLTGGSTKEILEAHVPKLTRSSLPVGDAVVVFISSSVPLETLRNYARDIEALGDPQVVMAMRGFVGGAKKAMPTLKFIWRVLAKDSRCEPFAEGCEIRDVSVHIDPVLFQDLGITHVPAVAYVKGLSVFQPTCDSEDKLQAWVLYGDVSLPYALELLSKKADEPALAQMAQRLRNQGFYGGNTEKEEGR